MALIQLVYTSTATRAISDADLEQIIASARSKNPASGITGMLFYADGHFMQMLEGEDAKVDDTLARVRVDPRHTDVTVTERHAISERSFSEWSMGFKRVAVHATPSAVDTAAAPAGLRVDGLAAALLKELNRQHP